MSKENKFLKVIHKILKFILDTRGFGVFKKIVFHTEIANSPRYYQKFWDKFFNVPNR